ncbi:hypothetical protein DACRYDRAFT_60032, partial [Dacryopinax primogenitus]
YDYLLMFPKERRYIWGAKWTPGKILFVLVRYMPFIDLPLWPFDAFLANLPLDCDVATYITIIGLVIACVLADVVYGLRTWALWSRNRYVGWFLLFAGVAFNGTAIIFLVVIQPNVPGKGNVVDRNY